jgi:hypothetical protein
MSSELGWQIEGAHDARVARNGGFAQATDLST